MFDSNSYNDPERRVNKDHTQVIPMRGEVYFEQLEEKKGGLILPTGFRSTSDTVHGRITNVGRDSNGLKVGEKIIAERHHALRLDFNDKTVYKIGHMNILAVMDEGPSNS